MQTGQRLAAIACSVVVACSPTSTTRPDAAPTASLTGTPSPETVRDDLAQFEVKVVSAPAPGGPTVESYMTSIDFDHDGGRDVVIAWHSHTGGGHLQALRNNGSGNFVDATERVFDAAATKVDLARNFAVADFNGDGLPDLAIADSGPDNPPFPGAQSRIFIGTAAGKLVDETASRLPQTKAFTHDICAGDIDSDGDSDLYLSNLFSQGGTGPGLYLNDGSGHFTATTGRLGSSVGSGAVVYTACRFVDVDRDSDLDLVLGPIQGSNVPREALLLNDGHGKFSPSATEAMPLRAAPDDSTIYVEAADFSGDGWPDLLLTTYDKSFRNGKAHLLINRGNGSFEDRTDLIKNPPQSTSWFVGARVFPRGPGSLPGFAMGPPATLFLPTGTTFAASAYRLFTPIPASGDVLPFDVDGDGKTDLFVNTAYGLFVILLNLGP